MNRSFILVLLFLGYTGGVFGQCLDEYYFTYDPPVPESGYYEPGTTVEICLDIPEYNPDGFGAAWLHGLDLVIPAGWDMTTLEPGSVTSCDSNSTESWTWVGFETTVNGLNVGPGLFFDGGNDGNPFAGGFDWGDPCNDLVFCWEITIAEENSYELNNLCPEPGALVDITIEVNTTSDSETGGWVSGSCMDDPNAIPYQPILVQCPTDDECTASSENCDRFINSVSISDITNTTECDDYSLHDQLTELYEGEEYELVVETQDSTGEEIGFEGDQVAAWIDWNGNDSFADEGEQIFIQTYGEDTEYPNSAMVQVPENVQDEVVMMRVRMSNEPVEGQITPCDTTLSGEVEDYPLWIRPPLQFSMIPSDQFALCTEDTDPTVQGQAVATTICPDSVIDISYEDQLIEVECSDEYDIVRTWTAQDNCGNEVTHDQVIEVMDLFNPDVYGCYDPIYLPAENGNVQVPDLLDYLELSDNCTQTISFEQEIEEGTYLSAGSYEVEVSAEDECGNVRNCEVDLIILPPNSQITVTETEEFFEMSCPGDTSIAQTGDITASTNCPYDSLEISYSDELVPGMCEGEYSVFRTWTMQDSCGTVDEFVQEISVIDTISPDLSCPISEDEINTIQEQVATPDYIPQAFGEDNCVEDVIIEQNPAPGELISDGEHEVVLTASDQCGNSSEHIIDLTVYSTSSLRESLSNQLEVYPNPTDGVVKIRYPELLDMVKLELYSPNGKLLQAKSPVGSNTRIDISHLPNGLYLLKFISNKGVVVEKVSKAN